MAFDGGDFISGGEAGETLSGLGGHDTISGGGGDDVLYGYGAADEAAGSGLISAQRIVSGLERPVFAASPPGDPGRLFVVEQTSGKVQIVDLATGAIAATPFLDLPASALSTGGERGLLGLAFHPDYASNGRFYLHLTGPDGDVEVREFTRSGSDTADPASSRPIIRVEHSAEGNHNGGWIGFGPDGLLYVSIGDGGGQGDPDNDAQNTSSLLGKILRLDVNGDAFPGDPARNYAIPAGNPFSNGPGADEVYAYGLRNPFRASFDPATGDFYIGDVGGGRREEVDYLTPGSAGANFGWHVREGDVANDTETPGNPGPDDPSLVDPVAVYDHTRPNGGFSITGGVVNRGAGGLQGHYLFADFVTNNVWTLKIEGGVVVDYSLRTGQLTTDAGTLDQIAAFATDGTGRVYAVGLDGEIHRLTPTEAAADGWDTLLGGAGSDRLFGGIGDDTLDGGAGADRLDGGLGFNRLTGGEGLDLAVYSAAQGVYADLAAGVYDGGGRYDRYDSIEGLSGGVGADALFGDAAANTLLGEGGADVLIARAGSDRLVGGGGNDWLDGGEGGDRLAGGLGVNTLRGGAGVDVADYSDRAAGVWVDLAAGVYSGPEAFDSLIDIEGLLGSNAGDALYGDDAGNSLSGIDGNDLLDGRGGADMLAGGAGDDTLLGGAGPDRLIGGAGVDILTGGSGADVFDLGRAAGWDVARDFESVDRIALDGLRFTSLVERDADGDGSADDSQLSYAGGTFVALDVTGLSLDAWNALVV